MDTTVLQPIPNTGKFRLTGLKKEHIEILKNNKGNILKALTAIGGTALVAQVIHAYNQNATDPIPMPEPTPIDPSPDPSPIEPTPEPNIPISEDEIEKVIDIEDTINNFEELDIDNDLINEVVNDIEQPVEIDKEMNEFINSDDILVDLNDEEFNDVIINNDYIDEEQLVDDEVVLNDDEDFVNEADDFIEDDDEHIEEDDDFIDEDDSDATEDYNDEEDDSALDIDDILDNI